MKGKLAKVLPSAGVLAMLMAGTSFAQEAAPTDDSDEIVVTGTSIRGIDPVGGQVVSMDDEDIQASGATSGAMVLARIPQLSDFGMAPAVQTGNNFQFTVNRPSLRGLSIGSSSTSSTLILMDGHRLPGSGVLQTYPDPDVIPSSLIERVEVVPDGGSSIYGSDAVGGVINFITRSSFDGFEVDGRHGFGDGFDSDEASLTWGRDWQTGSVFVAYSYAHRDPIAGADRDYVHDIDWATGLGTENRCATPNVTIGSSTTALGGGPAVRCDPSHERDLFSEDTRNSVLAGWSQELGVNVDFQLKAWYTAREIEGRGGPLRVGGITVAAASPFSLDPGNNQSVNFSFASVQPTVFQTNDLETWGFSPSLTWDLGHDWQMRAFLNYGHSRTSTHNPTVTVADVQAAVNAQQVNPYNLTDPTRIANVNALLGRREVRGYGQDEIANARAVFDGPLFSLPGGEVRLAVGAEQFRENFETFSDGSNNFLVGAPFTPAKESRDVSAAFAELNIPIVGEDNNVPFIHSLDVSLSVRGDDYSDFGEATTQRYGFTYEPVDWVTISGHWGDSFQAPGLADIARTGNIFIATPFIPQSILVAPSDITAVGAAGGLSAYNFLGVQGTSDGLMPQTADSWSIGFDATPPIFGNRLSFGLTYWNIDYSARIGSALTFIQSPSVFTDFSQQLQHDPAGLSYADAALLFPDAATLLAGLQANGKPLYAVYDFRNTNTGADLREGIDMRLRFTDDTSFGTWYANFDGSLLTNVRTSPGAAAPLGPDQTGHDDNMELRYQASLGVTIGENFLGQVTWNHLDGTVLTTPLGTITPANPADDQTKIDAFDTFDVYLQYDMRENLTFSLGVYNATDQDPPELKRTTGPSAGFTRSTLGRVVQMGVSAHF